MAPPAFATHDDLKALLGRPDLDNSQCDLALRSASATIRNYTGQYLSAVVDDTVELDGGWGVELELPERPVSAVHLIQIQWAAVPALTVTPGMYQVKRNGKVTWAGGLSSELVANAPEALTGLGYWGGPQSKIIVDYDHGFANGALPDDIWSICLAIASRLVTNPANILRESIDADGLSVSTQYARTTAADLEPEEQLKLNRFRTRAKSLLTGR